MASVRIKYDGSREELRKKLVSCIEDMIESGEWKKYNPYPNSWVDTQEFLNRLEDTLNDIANNVGRKIPLDEFTWSIDALVRDCYKEVGAEIIEEG